MFLEAEWEGFCYDESAGNQSPVLLIGVFCNCIKNSEAFFIGVVRGSMRGLDGILIGRRHGGGGGVSAAMVGWGWCLWRLALFYLSKICR